MDKQNIELDIQKQVKGILQAAIEVITKPKDFFSITMPKTGGFLQPLIFMIAMGLVSGLILSIFSLFGFSPAAALVTGLSAIILMPIMVGIFGFISAAVLFAIWKVMGSQETFETAYRGMAYTAAIMPITTFLNLIPFLGGIIGLAWTAYLLVVVSTEVHNIKSKTAWMGFGTICAIFVLLSVSTEIAARRIFKSMDSWQQQTREIDRIKDMSPEEAGRAMGSFLRGLQEASEEQKK